MLNVIILNVMMLNVIMLNVIMLNAIILNVIKLNVIMLNVIMLNTIIQNVIMLNVIMLNVIILSVITLVNCRCWYSHTPKCRGAIHLHQISMFYTYRDTGEVVPRRTRFLTDGDTDGDDSSDVVRLNEISKKKEKEEFDNEAFQ